MEGLLLSHIRPLRDQGPALSYNSPAASHTTEIYLNIASCFTAYCRAAQDRVRSGDDSWQLQC